MSKWLWLVGAGVGTVVLAGAGRRVGEEAAKGSGGGDGGDAPAPAGGGEPTPVEPTVEPYVQYSRGPYTIDLTELVSGVRWRAYATADQPANEAAKEAVKLGAGLEENDEDARIAAEAYVDALGVLPVEPYPVPPKPTPYPPDGAAGPGDGSSPPPGPGPIPPKPGSVTPPPPPAYQYQGHGLNVYDGCTRISVDSIVSWVAWAESWIRGRVAFMPRAVLVRQLLEATFPECAWDLTKVRVMGGRPLLQTLGEVDGKYFAPRRAGKPWPEQSPWEPSPLERAVAELVGAEAPAIQPPEFAYLGYHVEVEETPEGWVWRAWRRGKHEGPADLRGVPEHGWQAAVLAAKVGLTEIPG